MDNDDAVAVRRLIDKDQIIDLVHRYSYGVDHQLYDEVVELFTEDCVVDYGPSWPPVRSKAGLRRIFGRSDAEHVATSHHNANVLVTFVDLDHASVRASVYAWHRRADGTTPRLWGYYHDSVVRLPEGWRIAERQLRALGTEDWNMEMHSALEKEGRQDLSPDQS
jgi:3-phenylpropionate/cinnamic acid dioxygenase small subunit